jgi:hypothetical protein
MDGPGRQSGPRRALGPWPLGLALLGLALLGCGYRFTPPNASLPGGVRSVNARLLQNRTTEPSVEALVTQALREQLARSGLLGGESAEATLDGAVVSVGNGPLGFGSPGRLPIYRLSVTVQLTLARGGETLAQTSFTEAEEYASGADAVLTEANRAAALRRVCEVIARGGAERLSSNW